MGGYRGMHMSQGPALEEARSSSSEHQRLMDFLSKHGKQRLLDPGHRAALLGEKGRGLALSKDQPSSASNSEVVNLETETKDLLTKEAHGPLWKGVSDAAKETLLKNLGRNFVVGHNQDMDGRAGKHEPFKTDPQKQARYAQFCLALEGKASAAEALRQAEKHGQTAAEQEAEFAEFGRVYRLFRQERPQADIAVALDMEETVAPALRRTVQVWAPDKLLCKRWGVPEPAPRAAGELPSAQRQQQYKEQVNIGLSKVLGGASAALPAASEVAPSASHAAAAP